MRGIFDIDSPLMNLLGKITDCILLSLCWITACLPVVTIGAACGALYRTVYRCIRRDDAYALRTFWKSYKENLKHGILVWLPILGVYAFLIADAIILRAFIMESNPGMSRYYGIVLVLIGVCSVWAAYCTSYCIRFNGTVKEVLTINFILVLSHPLVSVEIMLFLAMGTAIALLVPFLLILLPCFICLMISFPMERVYMKHMSPEDLEKLKEE